MSASYEAEWRARFGDDADLSQEVPESAWLRQVLMRRTHRRYADRPVPEPLLRLLLGTAFSASSRRWPSIEKAKPPPRPPASRHGTLLPTATC